MNINELPRYIKMNESEDEKKLRMAEARRRLELKEAMVKQLELEIAVMLKDQIMTKEEIREEVENILDGPENKVSLN